LLQRVKVKAINIGEIFAFGVLPLEGGQQVHCDFGPRRNGGGIQGVLGVQLDTTGIGYTVVPSFLFFVVGGNGCGDRFARQRARLSRQDLHLDGVFLRGGIFEFLIGSLQIAGGDHQGREENREARHG
jgi:hypothetical protein